jgi:hypothetical protein
MGKSVANKADVAFARFAAGLCLRGRNSENGAHSVTLFTAGHRAPDYSTLDGRSNSLALMVTAILSINLICYSYLPLRPMAPRPRSGRLTSNKNSRAYFRIAETVRPHR